MSWSSTPAGPMDLQIERPKRPGEFTFTWSIHDFSYCAIEYGRYISSEPFKFLGNSNWCLWLYPKGFDFDTRGSVSCFLRSPGGDPSGQRPNFTISIRNSDGQFKEGNVFQFRTSSPKTCTTNFYGYKNFLRVDELKGPGGYLVNDTLTVRCRLWNADADIPTSIKCDVHSRVNVAKLDYMFVVKGKSASNHCTFDESLNISNFFPSMPILMIRVFNEEGFGDSALQFQLGMAARTRERFFMCVINFLDANGGVVHSVAGQNLFKGSESTDVFSFPLISKDNFYVTKTTDELTLQCKFGFSTADSKLETFVYQTTKDVESQPAKIDQDLDLNEVWMKNMVQCYEDGKFSDFVIRTSGRQFHVNRTILSAHSEVFDAMFERDMKERQTGEVNIEDLDDDIVCRMLMYVYTNTFRDVDSSTAQKLYHAAHKYRITTLQKKCAGVLKMCLDTSNACEVLALADIHQDKELKSLAKTFIQAHTHEVMRSEGWKKLKETNVPLILELI